MGMSLGILQADILRPALVIGGVTFMMTLLGTWIGNRFGHLFEKQIEILGGLVLILIGLKILIWGS